MTPRHLVATLATAALSIVAVPTIVHHSTAAAPPAIRFGAIQYDPPGNDSNSNASLNAEWVTIRNHGTATKSLTGWKLRDAPSGGHIYTFPTFTLKPGKRVRVHTGRGTNTATDLYWRLDSHVWNNSGDTATLKRPDGVLVDRCAWGDGPGTVNC